MPSNLIYKNFLPHKITALRNGKKKKTGAMDGTSLHHFLKKRIKSLKTWFLILPKMDLRPPSNVHFGVKVTNLFSVGQYLSYFGSSSLWLGMLSVWFFSNYSFFISLRLSAYPMYCATENQKKKNHVEVQAFRYVAKSCGLFFIFLPPFTLFSRTCPFGVNLYIIYWKFWMNACICVYECV